MKYKNEHGTRTVAECSLVFFGSLLLSNIQGGELYNRINQDGPLREINAAILFKQLCYAVQHMHHLGFVHRDIKAENVLLVGENKVKLADFGFSTQLINGSQQKLDTL